MKSWVARRRWFIGLAIAALVLVLAVVAVVLIHPAALYNEVQTLTWPRHFTPDAWQQHPDQRYRMALDLAKSGALAGKSGRWLRETLGSPVAAGESDAGGVLVWPVPSPQRPDDVLIVQLRDGVAVHWGVTSDPFTVVG